MAIKRILVVSGSRADYGMLEWPIKVLLDSGFEVDLLKIWGASVDLAYSTVQTHLDNTMPDLVMLLGDRYEILAAATAAHLRRVPIAHLCGGDVSEGSYDDAMRDAISRMASIHFVTSTSAMARLTHMGYRNVHLIGSTGIDCIKHAHWRKERPIAEPYVLVAYYPETIDGIVDLPAVEAAIAGRRAVWCSQNHDAGSDQLPKGEQFTHDEFLNLLVHCEEFIGNSSAMLYEAPELGVRTRMIGKRQRGRVIPWGDGNASERIAKILRYCA